MQFAPTSRADVRGAAFGPPEEPEHGIHARVAPPAAVAVAVCVVALLAAGGRPPEVPPGLPDAGVVTGWAVRLVRLLGTLAAVLTVGSLMVGAVLVRGEGARAEILGPAARRAVRVGGGWAAAWAALAIATVLLTVSETAGVPIAGLDLGHIRATVGTGPVRAFVIMSIGAAVVAAATRSTRTVRGCRGLLAVALASVVPPAFAGHASTAPDPSVASSAVAVHVVAATVWTGGLAALLLHLRSTPTVRDVLPAAAVRFSTVALGAYVALALSGLLSAGTRMPSSTAWSSGYGGVVAAKVVLLLVLGMVGHLHRRRSLPSLALRRPRSFLRLAGFELVLMGAAVGLAAALAHTPVPPAEQAPALTHGSGHSSLPMAVDPFTLGELATAWRPNALVIVALGFVLTAYVSGVRRVSARGRGWPVPRTAAFVAGLVLALGGLCSGVATYAPAMVSVQVVQLLVLLLAVPALLTLGAPLRLWWVATDRDVEDGATVRWSRAARTALTPLTGAALASCFLVLLYRTPLVELSMRSTWVHLLVLLLALGCGMALMWPVLRADAVPDPRSRRERASCVGVLVVCLALLAVQLAQADRLLAGEWFLELRWGWVDPAADQRRAGEILAGVALAVAFVALGAVLTERRATHRGSPGR